MSQVVLVIVTGLPATGKSVLGNELAQKLELPFISRDAIKERLFDSLGWSDREWSKKIGTASYTVMNYVIEAELTVGRSILVESNFVPEYDSKRFQEWQACFGFTAVQVVCSAEGGVAYERFKRRAESGERHPGHVDTENYAEFIKENINKVSVPLALAGEVIEVDTTDFTALRVAEIVERIRSSIHAA